MLKKQKQKVVKVKAWAIFVNGRLDIATPSASDAEFFAKETRTTKKKITPCTISFSLPSPKKK